MDNYNIDQYINPGDRLQITRPDGTVVFLTINAIGALTDGKTDTFTIDTNIHNSEFTLNWHNCYSFGNGVESNRVRDSFNKPAITPGVRVSTIYEDYKEEHKKYSLIYSGLYNSNSGINNLNQFIQAEKITKDINPIHGSIQKLHTRDTDLVTLCEDKILRILANKDAVYNADGNPQLVATQNVLGQTVPFTGEYGISKNPESFVSEAYRAYFTDKQRGAVMRLSKDGLTPISNHGMKDWFKDNLKNTGKIIGSYDDRGEEYNLTITTSGLNLLSNSNFNTGGVVGETLQTNEITNSALANFTPAVTTSNLQFEDDPYLMTDGHMDSLYDEYYLNYSPMPVTWSCECAASVVNSNTFAIQDVTPLIGLTDKIGGSAPWEIQIFSINGIPLSGGSISPPIIPGTHRIDYGASLIPASGGGTTMTLKNNAAITLTSGDTVDFVEYF